MVKYHCFRCGYTNNIKSRFIKHLNRKFTCKPILNNIESAQIYNNYFSLTKNNGLAKLGNGLAKLPKSLAKLGNRLAKLGNNEHKNLHICKYCGKKFKHLSSKCTHEKKRCKLNIKNEEYNNLKKLVKLLNEQLEEQKNKLRYEINKKDNEIKEKNKQIEELIKKTGIKIITNNNINNIQNNIKILAYNKSDLSHLKDNDYIKFIKHSNFCIPYMIKKIHFDRKKPENHNIYISNMKNNFVMVYDGGKWNIRDRNELITDMIEDNTNILEDKIEDWIERGEEYPEIMKKFNRYLEKKENDIVLNKIKQEIKFILFNNRGMIKNVNI